MIYFGFKCMLACVHLSLSVLISFFTLYCICTGLAPLPSFDFRDFWNAISSRQSEFSVSYCPVSKLNQIRFHLIKTLTIAMFLPYHFLYHGSFYVMQRVFVTLRLITIRWACFAFRYIDPYFGELSKEMKRFFSSVWMAVEKLQIQLDRLLS